MRPKTYPKAKVIALCEELGHKPEEVSRITIDPAWITVEFTHPITDGSSPTLEAVPVRDE